MCTLVNVYFIAIIIPKKSDQLFHEVSVEEDLPEGDGEIQVQVCGWLNKGLLHLRITYFQILSRCELRPMFLMEYGQTPSFLVSMACILIMLLCSNA